MNNVVLGFLGIKLDAGAGQKRWSMWRPSISICQHDDLLVDRFELLVESKSLELAEAVIEDIASVSPETKVNIHEMPLADPWDFEEVYGSLHDFTRSYDFQPERENYLAHITTGTHVAQICLFLLTESRHLPGQLLQTSPPKRKSGPREGLYRIIDLDLSRYDRLATRFEQEQQESVSFLKAGIETRSKRFNQLIDQIEHVALQSDAPMLLTGPTGAGKSRLARRIYELKHTKQKVEGDFVEVNCAMLRGDQAMSTLFGHVKGAFTGATSDRKGLLRTADNGMLFLDEIGELGPDEQAMLLRALEEKRFLPVGADKEEKSDFQLIAGTNRDLRSRIQTGEFREDLLARIDLWTFELPGLADRREDIEPNIEFELSEYTNSTGREIRFNKEARDSFIKFATSTDALWSANFRDLNAAIVRMATLAPTGRISKEIVAAEIQRLRTAWSSKRPSSVATELGELAESIDVFDQHQLAHVISVCKSSPSLSNAGRELFNVSRLAKKQPNDADRLRKYLAKHGLTFAQLRSPIR